MSAGKNKLENDANETLQRLNVPDQQGPVRAEDIERLISKLQQEGQGLVDKDLASRSTIENITTTDSPERDKGQLLMEAARKLEEVFRAHTTTVNTLSQEAQPDVASAQQPKYADLLGEASASIATAFAGCKFVDLTQDLFNTVPDVGGGKAKGPGKGL